MGYTGSKETNMSTDIFDEKSELLNARSFVSHLHNKYNMSLKGDLKGLDHTGIMMRSRLAANWPGDEEIRRMLLDISAIMVDNNIKPGDIK